jgi:putative peptidoglycan lipid II flippase
MNLMKAMATVAGMTGLSRVAGFARDILTASILGAGPIADAFFVALKLPNMFRRITAEGAFNVSFVPLYGEALEKEGADKANAFAGNALSIMLWALSGFTVLMLLAMPWVIYAIAPGFSDDPLRYDMAVELARVTFPYLLLMSMVTLFGGVLNAHERFAPFAAAPILFNLSLIGALLFLTPIMQTAGHAMAWGVLGAGLLQLGLLYICTKRAGIKIRLVKPQFDARTKKLFKLMLPGVLGAGVMQINLFADLIMASFLESGSISYLYYADRLNQLPLGIVGIAVGTALLPMLSRAISAGKAEEARNLFNRAFEVCFLLALPASVALMIIPHQLVGGLFEYGAFDAYDARLTAMVLMGYAVGLPAYVVARVFQVAYWANHDTSTPVKISMVTTGVNIALSLTLIQFIGVIGIALATGVAGWLQLYLLRRGLKGQAVSVFDEKLRKSIVRIIASSAIMGVGLIVMTAAFDMFIPQGPKIFEIFSLVLLVCFGLILYGFSVLATGAVRKDEIKSYFKRT